jgi:DNA invertase Pin-like site-specific DNA recombinase
MTRFIGYARVSTDGQTVDAQIEALEAAGATAVFEETASGARTDRAQLAKAIGALRTGDTLIVTRLDRLARSTRDLLNTLDAVARKPPRSSRWPTPGPTRPLRTGVCC